MLAVALALCSPVCILVEPPPLLGAMPRRNHGSWESAEFMSAAQVCRESIRVLLLHPTHFQSISFFFFSPLAVLLFISHFLLDRGQITPFFSFNLSADLAGENSGLGLKMLSCSILSSVISFPASITFAQLGKAATIQAVTDSYHGVCFRRRRLVARGRTFWVKLLHTFLWEIVVILGLSLVFVMGLVLVTRFLITNGICSRLFSYWIGLGLLGPPFCFCFAHVMVVGDLAKVVTVLEADCCGLNSLSRARDLIKGRRQTALLVTLVSNVGLKLVEGLYDFRLCKGMSSWEIPILVSMYSFMLVLDTVLVVVFYHTGKQEIIL